MYISAKFCGSDLGFSRADFGTKLAMASFHVKKLSSDSCIHELAAMRAAAHLARALPNDVQGAQGCPGGLRAAHLRIRLNESTISKFQTAQRQVRRTYGRAAHESPGYAEDSPGQSRDRFEQSTNVTSISRILVQFNFIKL